MRGLKDKPVVRAEGLYLVDLYREARYGAGGELTYVGLQAFSEVTGSRLTPWEAQTLLAMDKERLHHGR